MRYIGIALVTVILAGCAHQPMPPAQQAMWMQMMQHQQDMQQRNYDAQMRAIQAWPNTPQSTNCVTSYNNGVAYTNCY